MYNEKSALVKLFDANTSGVAFITSIALHGYVTVSAHYITDEWEMKTAMLDTRHVEERHTGEDIGNILKGIQSEFNVKTVPAVTTDNASKMQWLHERQTIQMLVVFLIICS